ncbi:MAG: FAD-dependent oxidoreductase [Burkholderiales bacterium]|nr:FAD-dependent oxidoreductase [Burkholderiales bacterium]
MTAAPHPLSIWATTAHPAQAFPPLSGDLQTDVAVIGGGFTGLAAAHHLARAGVACAVLEAHDVGWGASGRNGGMAVLRYKTPWAKLARLRGEDVARRLHRLLLDAVDTLEATVQELQIDCGFARYGHITAANGRSAVAMLEADVQWLATAGDRTPRMLNAAETAELCGTGCYLGGYLDSRAAGIHPLDYTRGLAAGLARRGVPIFAGTAATVVREDGQGVSVVTAGGTVRAKQLVIGTNAYTELFRFGTDLDRRIVPVSTSVVTTAPLPEATLRGLLPQGHLVSDTRHLLNYFRIAPGNRLLFGGRGSLTGRESPEVYAGLERKLVETFPVLAGVAIDHRWSGKVAVTLDDFPHVGRLSPRISYAMGYGGRGVALTNLLGKLLAALARGEEIDAGPMSTGPFAPIPLHGLRIPAMKAVAGYYRLLDALKV